MDNPELIICPCCKITGPKYKDFEQTLANSYEGSSITFLICRRCGVFFKEIDGWNNYKNSMEIIGNIHENQELINVISGKN